MGLVKSISCSVDKQTDIVCTIEANVELLFWVCVVSVCRYDFVPPVKYDYLNAEEAEKKFEERHKTLNYFSVMLSRKLREEEGGEGGEGVSGGSGGKKKTAKGKDTGDLVRD